MTITADDVKRIAGLASLRVRADESADMATQLSAILDHMRVLSGVDTSSVAPAEGVGSRGTTLRADDIQHAHVPLAEIAPSMRDGFLLVPRLATHGASRADA